MMQLLLKGSPLATVSDNGWVTAELFLKWLDHFMAFTKPSKEQRHCAVSS